MSLLEFPYADTTSSECSFSELRKATDVSFDVTSTTFYSIGTCDASIASITQGNQPETPLEKLGRESRELRKPLPLKVLLGGHEEIVHKSSGRGRLVKTVKVPRRGKS